MNSFNDFAEKLRDDNDFAEKVHAAILEKKAAGMDDAGEVMIDVVKDFGYTLSEKEAEEIREYKSKELMEELSEEEMGKVSGGFLILGGIALGLAVGTYVCSCITEKIMESKKD